MEIEFLKSYWENKDTLESYPTILTNPEGKTLEEILELEELFNNGNPFPKVFREYLFIGGKFNALGFNDGADGKFTGLMTYYKRKMKSRGIQINRPFVIYNSFEGEVCSFIYLDEGDNPQPWNASMDKAYDTDEGERIWKVPHATFGDLINSLVDSALRGLQPF